MIFLYIVLFFLVYFAVPAFGIPIYEVFDDDELNENDKMWIIVAWPLFLIFLIHFGIFTFLSRLGERTAWWIKEKL